MGRWSSRDPIEEEGGLNLFGFVENDGINKYDSLGRVLAIAKPDKIVGMKCSPCCKRCEKAGNPKIEDDGTKGTRVKAKVTSVNFNSVYTADKCHHKPKCSDCCAVYYRWWTCYTKRCQLLDGGPKLDITVTPNFSTRGFSGLNVGLPDGYRWCSCENERWVCKDERAGIIGINYDLLQSKSGSYMDDQGRWYGWVVPAMKDAETEKLK